MSEQLSLSFDQARGALSGMALWREMRAAQIDALARRSGLPIGHAVRVSLASGVLIEGRLLLARDELWSDQQRSPELRLQIGRVDFRATEGPKSSHACEPTEQPRSIGRLQTSPSSGARWRRWGVG